MEFNRKVNALRTRKKLKTFFDKVSRDRSRLLRKNRYYYQLLVDFHKFHIPEDKRVMEIGCGTGFLLDKLKPSYGVGIDISSGMIKIAESKYPSLHFVNTAIEDYISSEKFDFIVINDTIGYFIDIQFVFNRIRQNCTAKTRIIITSYNYLWEPILKISSALGLKMEQPFTNWLSPKDITNLLELEHFETIKKGRLMLFPKYVPLVSTALNRFISKLPFISKLCLVNFIVARPLEINDGKSKSVSVIVAARNERGHIEKIVESMPKIGKTTELIFVEGGSTDGTYEKIEEVAQKYVNKNILYTKQEGIGKGDAVRKGFEIAKGEILLIYDADMTVPFEDLQKFYDAIIYNKGEFIMGSRLIYPMEKQAMRTLNLIGNKMFSVMFTWLLDQRIKDTLCGTKVITRDNYKDLAKTRKYFGTFDPFGDFDLIFGASKMNLRIREIPIRYQERTYGATNISRFSHGWLLIRMCIYAMKKIKFV